MIQDISIKFDIMADILDTFLFSVNYLKSQAEVTKVFVLRTDLSLFRSKRFTVRRKRKYPFLQRKI